MSSLDSPSSHIESSSVPPPPPTIPLPPPTVAPPPPPPIPSDHSSIMDMTRADQASKAVFDDINAMGLNATAGKSS